MLGRSSSGRRVLAICATTSLAVSAITLACVGTDPVTSERGDDKDASTGGDGDVTDGGPGSTDGAAAQDAGPGLDPPDGSIVFAVHLPQNIGSPPYGAAAFDPAGNAYLGMKFNVATSLGGKSMTPVGGGSDVGVVKLGPKGDALWMTSFGGSGSDDIAAIAANASHVYVVGGFNSSDLTPTPLSLPHRGNGQYDAFLVKIDASNGNIVDAVDLVSTTGSGSCNYVAVRGAHLAVGCTVNGTSSFRDATGAETDKSPVGASNEAVVALLDPSNLRAKWVTVIGGDGQDRVAGLGLASNGDVFVAGAFESTTLADSSGFVSLPRKSSGNVGIGDAFLMRLATATGVPTWGKGYGVVGSSSTNSVYIKNLGVGPADDPFVVGDVQGMVSLGGAMVAEASDGGGWDAMLVRIDGTNGNAKWARAFGGAKYESGISVAADRVDGVFIGGTYLSPAFALDTTLLPDPISDTRANMYCARVGGDGGVLWAHSVLTANASSYTQASAAASDPATGAAIFAGTFLGTANLGDGKPAFSHLDAGGYDMFAIKRAP